MTRHYGVGTVQHLGGKKYRLFVSTGRDPVTGKRTRATKVITASSKTAAAKELAAWRSTDHGKKEHSTLGSLLDDYLANSPDMSPSTRVDFEGFIRRSIPKRLSQMKLRDVTPRDLDGLYLHLLREGGKGGAPLAPATVRRVHVILRAALERACGWGYITSNPAARARPPKVNQTEVVLPPADHLVRFLAHLDTLPADGPGVKVDNITVPPLPDFVALLLATGARPGELCALVWSDVDNGRIRIDESIARAKGGAVRKSTKTRKSRWVSVPQEVVDLLDARQSRYKASVLAAGVPLASFPVFPSPKHPEIPWRPDTISGEFREVRDTLNLSESLTMRNLRHYCVTVLAAGGVDVVTAARRMGHSPNVMLDVYAHVLDQADRDAASVLAANLAKVRKG